MASDEKLTCPNCGADIYYSDVRCLACGAALDEGQLADEIARQPAVPEIEIDTAQPEYETSPEHPQPWDPAAMAVGGGFWVKLERGWIFMKQAMTMWLDDKDLIIPSALGLLNLAVFFGLCYWILSATGLWSRLMSEEGESGLIFWIAGAVVALIAYVITYFYTAMTVNLVDTHLKGRDARLGEAFQDALQNLFALVSLAVLSTVVSLVSSVIRGKDRSIGRELASRAIDRTWLVATYLILPIIIIEDASIKEAISRGWNLHRSRLADVVVAEIGVVLVNRVLGTLAMLAALGLGIVLYMTSPALLPVAIIVAAAIISFAMIFTSYLRTAYYTCLYLWAAASEAAQQPVAAPKPLAIAAA